MSQTRLTFRPATLDDAPSIQALIVTAFRTHDTRAEWTGHLGLATSFDLDVAVVKASLANPNMATLLAFDAASALVGSVEVGKRGTSGAAVGRISMLVVDPTLQQGGVGRQVLAYAEEYARENWGAITFSLNALSTRPALIEWYMRRGYRKTGERSAFPVDRLPEGFTPENMFFVEMEKDGSVAEQKGEVKEGGWVES